MKSKIIFINEDFSQPTLDHRKEALEGGKTFKGGK